MEDSDQTDNMTTSDFTTTKIITNIPIKIYSHNDKKILADRISNIKSRRCWIRILGIVNSSSLKFTKNDNGAFFNIGVFPDDILSKIDAVLKYYENKKLQKISSN
jgi:hypothetical protein